MRASPILIGVEHWRQVLEQYDSWLEGQLERLIPVLPAVTVKYLTLSEAVTYFVKARPADPCVAKGILYFEETRNGRMTYWFFLDEHNAMLSDGKGRPYGRKIIVHQFDTELQEMFRKNQVLVFE